MPYHLTEFLKHLQYSFNGVNMTLKEICENHSILSFSLGTLEVLQGNNNACNDPNKKLAKGYRSSYRLFS